MFSAGVAGTVAGQTRIRGVGGGLIGVAVLNKWRSAVRLTTSTGSPTGRQGPDSGPVDETVLGQLSLQSAACRKGGEPMRTVKKLRNGRTVGILVAVALAACAVTAQVAQAKRFTTERPGSILIFPKVIRSDNRDRPSFSSPIRRTWSRTRTASTSTPLS